MGSKLRVAALSLALLLTVPAVAYADGDAPSTDANGPDDPGIAELHAATTTFREGAAAMRADCTGERDKAARTACRESFAQLRSAFKESRANAIEKHHAFREAPKPAGGRPEMAPAQKGPPASQPTPHRP